MAYLRDTINTVAVLMSGSYLERFNVDMFFSLLPVGSLSFKACMLVSV